ncbi:MAG: hypothetical protein V1834_01365 [Candidatus Micrarchaeota archaeon]
MLTRVLVLLALCSSVQAVLYAEGMAPWILTSAKSGAHALSWTPAGYGDRGGYRAGGCTGTSCAIFEKTGKSLLNPSSFECVSASEDDFSCLEWSPLGDCGMAGITEWKCLDYSKGPCLNWRGTCATTIETPSGWSCSQWHENLCVKWSALLSGKANCPVNYVCGTWNGDYCSGWNAVSENHYCFVNSWSCTGCEDYCAGVTCEDKCDGNKLLTAGRCGFGDCVFDSVAFCRLGCENAACKPNHLPQAEFTSAEYFFENESVVLNWSGFDEEGDAIVFELRFEGEVVFEGGANGFVLNATGLNEGRYSLALTPSDVEGKGNETTAIVTVTRPKPSPVASKIPSNVTASEENYSPRVTSIGFANEELRPSPAIVAPSSTNAPVPCPTPETKENSFNATVTQGNDAASTETANVNENNARVATGPMPETKNEARKADWSGAVYAAGGIAAAGLGALARRKKEFAITRKGNKNKITVRGNGSAKVKVKLMQILPEGADVEAGDCAKTELINGILLSWEKEKIDAGEDWAVEYTSSEKPLQTIFVYETGNKPEKKVFITAGRCCS